MSIIITAIIAVSVCLFTWIICHYGYKGTIQENADRVEYLRAAYREVDNRATEYHSLLKKMLEKDKGIVFVKEKDK